MPFIEGESLRDKLAREKKLAVPAAMRITDQVASALNHAHERGLVHRDIKPENILLSGDQAIVADFGIARAVEVAGGERLTGTGIAVGTPAYMSPEQAAGDTEIDGRSDVYALGCVVYEMVSGRAPFEAPTPQALLAKHVVDTAPSLRTLDPDIPLFLERAVSRALAKEPARRFDSPRDFATTLTSETVVPAEGKSIVVLPFENLSPDPDQEYFGDGLTEELIADLSKVRALHVISRTSAMLLKGTKKDMPTIARELSVRYVLEGSVRWAGKNLRITAQLIEAATDAHLWAEKYTGTLDDVFDLQEQLSRSIVEALKVTLTPEEDRHLASRDIPDAEAYALYIRARQEFVKMTEESLDLAEQLLERALAKTGPNALLLATAAEVAYGYQDMGYESAADTLDRADALATRALELDPDLAEAHVVKGLVAQRRFDTATSVRLVRRAVDLDPANAMAAWAAGFILAEVGFTDEARKHADRARALDPLFWPAQFGSALADLCDGNYESALAKTERMHTISGDNPVADLWLGLFLIYANHSEESAAMLDRAAAADVGTFSATATCVKAMVSGDGEALRATLADTTSRDALFMDTELTWMVAAASASVGELDEALYWLSRSIEMGFINYRFFAEVDPFLAKLRGDSRFEELMERAKEKQKEIGAKQPDALFDKANDLAATLATDKVAPKADKQRLAVLPPVNLMNDPEQDYFVQGMHNALISELQRAGVAVIARTSVMQYQDTKKSVRQIASELGANALAEPSVFRAGDDVEIEIRLVDGSTEEYLADPIGRSAELGNVVKLYREITKAIATEIHATLTPEAESVLASAAPVNPEAYEAYLRGQFHCWRLTPADLDHAMEYFQRALSLDPTYAPAQAGIAWVWFGRGGFGAVPPKEAAKHGRDAYKKALSLDSTLAEVQYAAALIKTWHEWDWEGAEDAFRKAIEINPNFPDASMSYAAFLAQTRRTREARPLMERALELDPANPMVRMMNGFRLMYERRFAEGIY